MSLSLELKKLRRTGYFPAFLLGALLAASFPIINTAARPDTFIHQQLSALDILMNSNWQMIATLNLFFLVIGSCIIYHTEYADRAMLKMEALPQRVGNLFAAKTVILTASLFFVLVVEAAALAFCACYWFGDSTFWPQLLKTIGYEFVLYLPSVVLMMEISSLCENLWVSLGIGVIGIFIVTMLPSDNFALSLFPFAMPFQTLAKTFSDTLAISFLVASGVETLLFSLVEAIILKVRRNLP